MKRTLQTIAAVIEPQTGEEHPAHPLKQRIKEWLVALSLAHMSFVSAWFTTLFDSDCGYFNRQPVNRPTLAAILVSLIFFAGLIWVLIQIRHRRRTGGVVLFIDFLSIFPILEVANFVRTIIFHIPDYHVYLFLCRPLVICLGVISLGLISWKHWQFSRGMGILAGILSPLAVLTLGKIVLLLLGTMHLSQHSGPMMLPSPGPVREGQPRVLWIIFDEADQRIVFDKRPADVNLPEFDRLRGQSIFSTRAYSPSDSTILSMPGLISGQRVQNATPISASDLRLEMADVDRTNAWKGLPSVFSEARSLGVNTAVIGWYHPYDRVLGSNLNFCVWCPYPPFEPVRSSTFARALKRGIACFFWTAHVRSDYVYFLEELRQNAVSLATNTTYGLTLMHLPPPHTPGVYLPKEDRFTIWGMSKVQGYLNNLILADKWLGQIRTAMEQAGVWDQTWVIVSADHSWRESQRLDGVRDQRVPFLVKPPNTPPEGGFTYTNQFNTIITRDFILALLRSEVTNAPGVTTWLEPRGSLALPVGGAEKYHP